MAIVNTTNRWSLDFIPDEKIVNTRGKVWKGNRLAGVVFPMCGRFALHHRRDQIAELFQCSVPEPFGTRYNIAPTQPILIVRENVHIECGREATHVVWGLIPPWAKDLSMSAHMINARCETAAEKPAFKHALRRRRCLIPASGFYEWPPGKQEKIPCYIHNTDESLLALAGIWEAWNGPNGEFIESASILTRASAGKLEPVFERMPVIIPPDQFALWLDSLNDDSSSLGNFFDGACANIEDLNLREVSRQVNSVRNDGPELLMTAKVE